MSLSDVVIKPEWTEKDWEAFRVWIRGMLHTNDVTITFTKADGTERVMRCTLDPEKYPPVVVKEGKAPRKESTTAIRVFDLDIKEWRSFTISSVKKVAFDL